MPFCATVAAVGSSPPARGTQWCSLPQGSWRRVIPACAGNTGRRCWWRSVPPGHPRLRGEHAFVTSGVIQKLGSSPPARGTHHLSHLPHGSARVIPACAGNTRPSPLGCSRPAGHPRLRGEHFRSHLPHRLSPGSSPPARGTHVRADLAADARRVIPACAGNTPPNGITVSSLPGHPRLRGEHAPDPDNLNPTGGSSPPARGTHQTELEVRSSTRVIPACAGNTTTRPC